MNAGQTEVTPLGDLETQVRRTFAAPRALVFDAYTQPELLQRWLLGPPGWEMDLCDVDLRVGGAYRYAWVNGDERMALSGTFEEVVPGERLVSREDFDDDWTGGQTRVTVDLTEVEGVTTLTMTIRYQSREARDAALAMDFAAGLEAGFQRLDALAAQTS